LQGVLQYVESQLQTYGIRFPRLYPVSSIQALDAKWSGDHVALSQSGLPVFEQEFIRFSMEELGQMAIQSGEQDLLRAEKMIRQWIEAAQADEVEKQRQLGQLQVNEQQALERCVALPNRHEADQPLIAQETQELLYYVKQRIRYRFGDLFHYAFNPATLRNDGQDLRLALRSCSLELHRLLAMELSQELLATTLRLEQKVRQLSAKHAEEVALTVQEVLPSFEPIALQALEDAPPTVEESLLSPHLDAKQMWSIFKNPKAFFEGDGKAKMRQLVESAYQDPMQSAVFAHEQRFIAHYAAYSERMLQAYANQLHYAIAEQSEGIRTTLTQQANIELLERLIQNIRSA
jgi:hypothetical protein